MNSLPNLGLLEHPETGTTGQVHLFYQSQPAPLGLADYGLGTSTYSYNTTHILGEITFNTPPNATQPGAAAVIEPSTNGQHDGDVGSPYEFGIQLNTVATNMSIPGSDEGFFWTQNVVNWNDTGIHFVDDTFNMTSATVNPYYIAPGTIYSGCNNNSAGVEKILYVYEGVFQCVGKTIPLSPASYPVTIQLYNNATLNAQDRTQVSYGYRIIEAGIAKVYTGISDTVVFNNTAAPTTAPANPPGFSIDGFQPSPTGLFRDAEIVIVGGIGGDNAVFRSINGTVNLMYSNASSGGFRSVPSAYNFGGDTGETSTGIADYWAAATDTLMINQGPSMLYGLWGAEPQVSVAPGDIELAGSITPSYGFVFVGNILPGVLGNNLSWMPTTNAGTFNTYLPPFGAPWTSTYYVQAFADGSAEFNGTVTASTTTYSILLSSAPGELRAPLYAFSNTQMAQLAYNVTGATAAPWVFSGFTTPGLTSVDVNLTFNHLNDYAFPSFEVFMTQGVTQVVNVTDVYEGTDSGTSVFSNTYFIDFSFSGSSGILTPGPSMLVGWPWYTSIINIWDGIGDQVYDQDLFTISIVGSYPQGSGLDLWQDTGAVINETLTENPYGFTFVGPGIWVGQSVDTAVNYTTDNYAIGMEDIGSVGTHVWSMNVTGSEFYYDPFYLPFGVGAAGIEALSSSDGTYSWVNATYYSLGIETGADYPGELFYYDNYGTSGLTVNDLNVTNDSFGANITYSEHTTFNHLTAYDPEYLSSAALFLDGTVVTAINSLVANYAGGIYAWNATDTSVTGMVLENYVYEFESVFEYSSGTTFSDLTLTDVYVGVLEVYDTSSTVDGATATDVLEFGYFSELGSGFTGTDLVATLSPSGIAYGVAYDAGPITVNDVSASGTYIGLGMKDNSPVTVSTVVVTDSGTSGGAGGVTLDDQTGGTVTGVTATDDSVGADLVDGSTGVSVSAVAASGDSYGVFVDDSPSNTISDVTATGDSYGVYVYDSPGNTVSDVTATDDSYGVYVYDSPGNTISDVTATDDSTGVYVDPSSGLTISDVSASGYSVGALLDDSWDDTVTTSTASIHSVAVGVIDGSHNIAITGTTISYESTGVVVEASGVVSITGVTASNTTLDNPWTGYPGLPVAAVATLESYQVEISNVVATNYGMGLWDDDSGWGYAGPGSLYVQNLNATGSYYAMVLNYTGYGYFNDIGSFHDYQGVWAYDAGYNDILGSSFVDDSSYGVSLWYGYYNYVWDSNFIGDNGATDVYSAAHIQAYAGYGEEPNYFDDPVAPYLGNYWADWHTYSGAGVLAPYYVGDQNWDYSPLSVPAGEVAVTFYESGLATGTSWSLTFNGVTLSTINTWLTFGAPAGSYAFTVGAVSGYVATPASGTVSTEETGPTVSVDVSFAAAYAVTLTETGLPSGTSWSAILGGVTGTSTTSTITLSEVAGTYDYQIPAVAGYSSSPSSGTITVSGPYALAIAFTATSDTVTVTESGLPTGTSWSAIVDGISGTSTTSTITLSVPAGTSEYQIPSVAGYAASPSGGTLTVSGAYAISVTFSQVTYAVTVTENGLSSGTSWSATVNGVTQTSVGTSVTFYLPNGMYSYTISAVSGYTLTGGSGSLTVNGEPVGVTGAYAPTSTPSVVSTSTYNTGFAVAIALAVIALVIGLVALFWRRKKAEPTSTPAQAWSPPSGGGGGSGGSGGSSG